MVIDQLGLSTTFAVSNWLPPADLLPNLSDALENRLIRRAFLVRNSTDPARSA